jgi:hypothetical protein
MEPVGAKDIVIRIRTTWHNPSTNTVQHGTTWHNPNANTAQHSTTWQHTNTQRSTSIPSHSSYSYQSDANGLGAENVTPVVAQLGVGGERAVNLVEFPAHLAGPSQFAHDAQTLCSTGRKEGRKERVEREGREGGGG